MKNQYYHIVPVHDTTNKHDAIRCHLESDTTDKSKPNQHAGGFRMPIINSDRNRESTAIWFSFRTKPDAALFAEYALRVLAYITGPSEELTPQALQDIRFKVLEVQLNQLPENPK